MRTVTLALVLLSAGCGGLGTPDLGTGVVVGRISGASTGGYVYPLGRPDMKVALQADGSFRLVAPAGAQSLVLVDGSFQQDATGTVTSFGRAEKLDFEVGGSDVRDLGERRAADMPLAGGVLAGVRAESGARCQDPRFRVEGTDREEAVSGTRSTAFLAPLPKGKYRLSVTMSGFKSGGGDVEVAEAATTPYDTMLYVDDDAEVRGCVATSGCDDGALECHSDDGRCHESGGGGGGGGGGSAAACGGACASDSQCAAGLRCESGVCSAPQGCVSYLAAIAKSCVASSACGALFDGLCDAHEEHPGVCTAPCPAGVSQCGAFGPSASCSSNVCRP